MSIKVYTLNSFAKTEGGGNPAGVVLNADHLSVDDMQKISAKVGFSETAFVKKSNKADFKVEFYTPNSEVDICGHATIGTFTLLAYKGIINKGQYTQETKAGILKIECNKNNVIYMEQKKPEFYEILDKKEIAQSLNLDETDIMSELPIQIVSTGLKDILIPVKSLKVLNNIKPDFNKISCISKKYGVVGYHVFTLETQNNGTAHCRNFAPLYDIPEEAATGTSTGALSCYLYRHGIINEKSSRSLVFEQGYSMRRPSEILSSLIIKNGEISEVMVGGTALNIEERFY
ncbi:MULTISPECIES: PhzF family phenazine biosynthesis protein [Clostridium]|uniref:PhzF family phenazine biosynthesis protein n=1 Tax=Clostridium TaxID=1485 RepID=UPI00069E2BF2|nr:MULTISPECIES: PhzF family phenazine biosynthesis protein [Clostridium]KOF57710.1 phenazine biosynthesis protein PhzF [Clostridium sp. DMHC 10]MCD2347615.1 PhzF family phenazine biosynthesis protein [Clostridium guangxiense]